MDAFCIFIGPNGNQRARLVTRNFAAFYFRLARVGFARRTSLSMKQIPLTKGYFALVDDEDFEWLNQWKWQAAVAKNTVYAQRSVRKEKGRRVTLRIYRAILKLEDSHIHVDHIDGNGLNNTRANIRLCTHAENSRNSKSVNGSSSRFLGVNLEKSCNKWRAQILYKGRKIHLGLFSIEEDAARTYNQAASKYFGEFAKLNKTTPLFPDQEWKPSILVDRNSSGFRGVSFIKRSGRWRASVKQGGKPKHLGCFTTAIEAAKAYDAKAIELFGAKARINFQNN